MAKPFDGDVFDPLVFDAAESAETIRARSRLRQRRNRYGWDDYGTFYPGYGR